MQLLLRWILSALALFITVKIGQAVGLPFYIASGTPGVIGLLLFVVILAVVNAILGSLLRLLTLPLSCLTFGLFAWLVNALMFWIAGQVTPGFHVRGFWAPLFGSVVMGLVSGALNHLVASDGERTRG